TLQNTYQQRVYCTQYQETDLEFIERLLSEEGVYYYFDHLHGAFTPDAVPDAATDTLTTVGGYIADAGGVATALAPGAQGSATAGGLLATGGGLLSAVADAITPQQDPEADNPVIPGVGKGGPPANGCEIFVFGDTVAGYSAATTEGGGELQLAYRM